MLIWSIYSNALSRPLMGNLIFEYRGWMNIMSACCTILAQGLVVQKMVHSLINADSRGAQNMHILNCQYTNTVYSISSMSIERTSELLFCLREAACLVSLFLWWPRDGDIRDAPGHRHRSVALANLLQVCAQPLLPLPHAFPHALPQHHVVPGWSLAQAGHVLLLFLLHGAQRAHPLAQPVLQVGHLGVQLVQLLKALLQLNVQVHLTLLPTTRGSHWGGRRRGSHTGRSSVGAD